LASSIFSRIGLWFKSLFVSDKETVKPQSEGDKVPSANHEEHRQRKPRRPKTPQKDSTSDSRTAPARGKSSSAPTSSNAPLRKKQLGDWQVPERPEQLEEGGAYFQQFPLRPEILRATLEDLGFKKCTPIQDKALPAAIAGKDIAGKAQTGTGKTAVFLMATIERFLEQSEPRRNNQPFALALAPTRELALQIAKDAENLSVYTPMRTVAVFGGMDYDKQMRELQNGVDLVVATPGRLIDFMQKRAVDTSKVGVLIIDEADRMLDMGFIPDVKRIIYRLPARELRQTMLFSATLSHDILNLASAWMRPEPVVVEIEPEQVVAAGINETVYACTSREKLPIMLWILKHEDCSRVIIFRNRKHEVELLANTLKRHGVECEMLSGDVNQNRRLRILEDFRNGKVRVVVATDVAARGIQVDNVTHVFNYDFPYEAEDYVHRVGRTARAGHKGRAISFADENSAFVIPDIEEYIGRALPITKPDDEMLKM
jgi:ATP-dependent RNA helicase RhlB